MLDPKKLLDDLLGSKIPGTETTVRDKAGQAAQMAREKPGTLRISILPGTMFEYMVEQVEAVSGAKFLKVPFQGGAPSVTALLGNNVDIALGFYGEIRSFLDAGKLKPVAVSSDQRSPFLKDAPTVNEALGRDDVVWVTTRWVAVPAGVPADRRAWLAAGFRAAAFCGFKRKTIDRLPVIWSQCRRMGAPCRKISSLIINIV